MRGSHYLSNIFERQSNRVRKETKGRSGVMMKYGATSCERNGHRPNSGVAREGGLRGSNISPPPEIQKAIQNHVKLNPIVKIVKNY